MNESESKKFVKKAPLSNQQTDVHTVAPSGTGVETARSQRACLLILGMHRSGTSAVCGVLHHLGAERPVREMPPQPDNEKGFFEPIEISAIHDRMLASAGLYWFDWEPMPRSWYESAAHEPFVDELVEAAKIDFPGRGPFLLKDPRVCRFVDVWLEALDRLDVRPVVVFQYRHPAEVAQSLRARDGFSIAHGLLMWLRHILEAEKATRAVERSFINYGNLLVDWRSELALVLDNSHVKFPKTSARAMALAGDFLDGSLRHQVRKPSRTDAVLNDWLAQSFDALERLRSDPHDRAALATFDEIRVAFDAASAAFSPAFHQMLLQIDHLGRIAGRAAEVETALVASQQALAAAAPAAERLPVVEADLEAARQHASLLQTVADRVLGLDAALEETRQSLATAQPAADRVPILEAELEGARQALAALQPVADRVPDLEGELAVASQALAALQSVAERVPVLEAERDGLQAALATVRPVAERVAGLEADLAGARQEIETIRPVADRAPHLETALHAAQQDLIATKAVAERLPGFEKELATALQGLAAVQPLADRVPDLEADLAAARRDIVEKQRQLDMAKLELSKTVKGRLAAAATLVRRKRP